MPDGKKAGVRCLQLTDDNCCRLFGSDLRPPVCLSLQPSSEMCGSCASDALQQLAAWEQATRPDRQTDRDHAPGGPVSPVPAV